MVRRRRKVGAGSFSWVIPMLFFSVAFALWILWEGVYVSSTNENIKLIRDHINLQGELVDYSGTVGVRGPEDIVFLQGDKEYEIRFGRLPLTWSKLSFGNEECVTALKSIGITLDYDEYGYYVLIYQDTEIPLWLK